ncbi:MAG: WD40 repeat domain-containing protein [Acidobacteriota bacterium]|nr:WD40 repeat domain-containing protein [Acidobacteriota bacterium]
MWDTTTGQILDTFTVPAGVEVAANSSAIFSPDGRPLYLALKDKHFELWDMMTRRSVVQLDPQSDDPRALQIFNRGGHLLSRDGARYYLPTEDFRIRVWDFKRGGKPIQVLAGHETHIETPALSHDGRLLASGSNDRTLRLWDRQTGKPLVTVKNESQTFSLAFSPDDKYLAAVCMRALRTKGWDVQNLLSFPHAIEKVQALGLTPEGKMLTYAEGVGPGLRDLQTGQNLLTFADASFSPCLYYDCVKVSADGKLIAIRKDLQQGKQGSVEIRESATGKVLAELSGHTGPISAVSFSQDGKTIATGGENDHLIKLWDTATWQERVTLYGHVGGVTTGLDFSSDSSRLVSSSHDATVKVWDVKSGKELFTLGDRNSWVLKTRFSPDGKLLASADMNFTVKLWDATTGRAVRTLKGHANSVYALAFSPDGKRLASGSDDKTVRLWDVQTGMELTALRGHTGEVWHVFFTPDGKTLVSSGEDGTRIWRTATEEEVRAHAKQ